MWFGRNSLNVTRITAAFVFMAAVLTMLLVPMAEARAGNVVLADEYPYASTFMQMSRRAVEDYMARNRAYPADVAELVAKGFTAYLFPAQTEMSLVLEGEKLLVDFNSFNSYSRGEVNDMYTVGAHMPNEELTFTQYLPTGPPPSDGSEREWKDISFWSFPGAQWLDNGFGWTEVERALKRERVVTHLLYTSRQFQFDNNLNMPVDFAVLEEYVGVQRNPACWDELYEVYSIDEVAYNPGNLFVGWVGDEWCISCNLGPELLEYRFHLSSNDMAGDQWVVEPFLGIY